MVAAHAYDLRAAKEVYAFFHSSLITSISLSRAADLIVVCGRYTFTDPPRTDTRIWQPFVGMWISS